MEFVRPYKQRATPASATVFDLQAQLDGWSAQGLRVGRWFAVSGSIETRVKTLGLGFERGNFHILLQSDSLHLQEAEAVGLDIGYRYIF